MSDNTQIAPLCGPIVRRVLAGEGTIWVAMPGPGEFRVELSVRPAPGKAKKSGGSLPRVISLKSQFTAASVRCSSRLAISMLNVSWDPRSAAESAERLGPRAWIAYRLLYRRAGDVSAFRPLTEWRLDGLEGQVLAPAVDGEASAILTASCRAMGVDVPDASVGLERSAAGMLTTGVFPILVLTGDQIYADVIPGPGFRRIRALAASLGLRPETVGMEFDLDKKPNGRKEFVRGLGYTTDDGESHLLYLREFIAAYLMAWNPDLWSGEEGRDTDAYRAGAASLRRTFANVPTYMCLDDHEVTDDWRINHDWDDSTGRWAKGSLGQGLQTLAVASYWLFQGWGNTPGHVRDGPLIKCVQAYCDGMRSAMDDLSRAVESAGHWSFVTPPPWEAIVLDTRTDRERPAKAVTALSKYSMRLSDRSRPRLLSNATRAFIGRVLELTTARPLVCFTQTPVIGVPLSDLLMEVAQRLGAGPTGIDAESWSTWPPDRWDLFASVAQARVKDVVFVSGDVHVGYIATGSIEIMDVEGSERQPPKAIRVHQLTASPLRQQLLPGKLIIAASVGAAVMPVTATGLSSAAVAALKRVWRSSTLVSGFVETTEEVESGRSGQGRSRDVVVPRTVIVKAPPDVAFDPATDEVITDGQRFGRTTSGVLVEESRLTAVTMKPNFAVLVRERGGVALRLLNHSGVLVGETVAT